jgi:hypothetical protein
MGRNSNKVMIKEFKNRVNTNLLEISLDSVNYDQIRRHFKKHTFGYDLLDPLNALNDHILDEIKTQILKNKGAHVSWKNMRLLLLSKTESNFPPIGKFRPRAINSF